jgi:hypothetical protein
MRQRQLHYPHHHLGRRGHRVALADRRQGLKVVYALELEAPRPIVLAPPDGADGPQGLADAAQALGHLQHRRAPGGQLPVGILRSDPTYRRAVSAPPFPQPGPAAAARQGRRRGELHIRSGVRTSLLKMVIAGVKRT